MSISPQPMASISSRTICAAFWCTRQPAGSQLHSPAPTCRARPARTISLCESASASAGGCFSVGRKRFDWRVSMAGRNRIGGPELGGGYRVAASMDRRLLAAGLAALSPILPAAANASPTQLSIMQDDDALVYGGDAKRDATLARMKALGVDAVAVTVLWKNVASRLSATQARRRDLRKPRSYGVAIWNQYDNLVRSAQNLGIQVYFSVTGPAPPWAHAAGPRKERPVVRDAWRPNATKFGWFVQALGTRYSGTYKDEDTGRTALPRVAFWGLWNEPNQAGWLSPQWEFSRTLRRNIPSAPIQYRKLFYAGRKSLDRTGHGGDLILLGETAPLGSSKQGRRSPLRPKKFLRELLCVTATGRALTGRGASARGCSDFEKFGPLKASGYGHHPYTKDLPPTKADRSHDSITMANINDLPTLLDRFAKTKRIPAALPVALTEFGYETNPPDTFSGPPLDHQAEYLNPGDYQAFANPRIISQTQFTLDDYPPVKGARPGTKPYWFTYQSGLYFQDGTPKPSAAGYALPFLAVPVQGQLGVWGQLRFRPNGITDQVTIERQQPDGSFAAVGDPVAVVSPAGFFQALVPYPGPGVYRAHWTGGEAPFEAASRTVQVG